MQPQSLPVVVCPRAASGLSRLSRACGAATSGLGALVLVAWAADLPALLRFDSRGPASWVTPALSFVVLGVAALLLHRRPRARWIRVAVAGVAACVFVLAAITLLQGAIHRELSVDQAMVRDLTPGDGRAPGRMAPAAALLLLMIAASMALLATNTQRWTVRIAQSLSAVSMAGATVAILDYAYDTSILHTFGAYTPIAFPTACGLLLCSLALLCAHPKRGFMRAIASAGVGGRTLRRLLPVAIILPAVMGWAHIAGARAGWYDNESGMALLAVSNMAFFGALMLGAAHVLAGAHAAQRRTDSRLQDNERDLAITLDSIGDGVVAADSDGHVTRVNATAQRLTGWHGRSGYGRRLHEVLDVVDSTGARAADGPPVSAAPDGSGVAGVEEEVFLLARDGPRRSIARRAAPIREGADGEARGVVVVFRDVSDEQRTRSALLESQTRFARLFESGVIGITVATARGEILEANDAFLRMLQYSRAELASGACNWKSLTPPEWLFVTPEVVKQIGQRGYSEPWEKEYLRKDGTRVSVLVGLATLDSERNIAVIADLSSLKAAQHGEAKSAVDAHADQVARQRAEGLLLETEEQLRQSQKMEAIGSLAGGIAHDFNNLLSVILSYSTMLVDELRPEDPMHEDLTEIVGAAERAAQLTRQLLAFSRQQVLQPRTLDLNETIVGVSKILARIIGEDVELVLKPKSDLGHVHVDPGQVEQVLLNLAVNARDAMPQGGKLTLGTAEAEIDESYVAEHIGVSAGSYVVLTVSDTGTGMDRATQARIFEPFFTTKEKGKGTGLGLATVFGIVKQSGGSVWVYSEVGRGTTFKVYLPRTEAAAAGSMRPPRSSANLDGTETVLLVEDDPSVRTLARTILRRRGYRVLEAASPGDALVVSENHQGSINLLLTDVVMPVMGGRALAERLRGLRPSMRVIFMSGYTDDMVLRHGVVESRMAFIQKPLLPQSLLEKVRQVLGATPPS